MQSLLRAVPKTANAAEPPVRSPAPARSPVGASLRPSAAPYDAGALELGARGDAFERDADRVAAAVSQTAAACTAALRVRRDHRSHGRVHRVRGAAARGGVWLGSPAAYSASRLRRGRETPTRVFAGVRRSVDGIRASGSSGRCPRGPAPTSERAFATSFADVRIHRTPAAARAARALSARAFTVGADVVFGEGSFEPSTERGRRVLAHELAHVEQQRAGVERIQRYDESTDPSTTFGQGVADALSILGPVEWALRGLHAGYCLSVLEAPMVDLTFHHWIPDVCGRRAPGVLHSREWSATFRPLLDRLRRHAQVRPVGDGRGRNRARVLPRGGAHTRRPPARQLHAGPR